MITPIENADDLASQADIPYGTLDSGSTMTFFRVRSHYLQFPNYNWHLLIIMCNTGFYDRNV